MEYVYAELVRNTGKKISTVPKSKLAATAVLLIISGDLTYSEVPTGYKTQVKAALKAQGYNTEGQPIEEVVEE